jgi:uncharacterized radical SAM protein YgiQ
MNQPRFLPMTKQEMITLGWNELDVLLISGDAYVDHPSFGTALIGRHLISNGFRVGIVAQPNWKDPKSVTPMGRPRLFAGITAGAMDSMVSNYTANKKLRRNDSYAPGDEYGLRPNRASIIYTNLCKQNFPGLPIVLGGIEASMRRLVHYDYWEEKIRRSLLLDAKADILVYGMGERPVVDIAKRLSVGANSDSPLQILDNIAQTVIVRAELPKQTCTALPSYEAILADKNDLAKAGLLAEKEHAGARRAVPLQQKHGNRYVIIHPPATPLSSKEMDELYSLPFARQAHPQYTEKVPALEPVQNSIVTHRGCFGGCSFCALGAHQGKIIQSRSQRSILNEILTLTKLKSFHGTITDLGGPSANMYAMVCQRSQGPCIRPSCVFPDICKLLSTSHQAQIQLLKAAKQIPGVKHVFIASGIRYDLAMQDPKYISALVAGKHISGAIKIAPEHTEPNTLKRMRKPDIKICEQFITEYRNSAKQYGENAYSNAYFIASFPGSTTKDMQEAKNFAQQHQLRIEQMQDFIPLPMTLAGIMFFTEKDPWTGEPLKTIASIRERNQQRRMLLGKYPKRAEQGKKRYGDKPHGRKR